MPFIAIDKKTSKRIDITKIEKPRATLLPEDLVCQLCGCRMMVKAGQIVRAHFAHYTQCTSDYKSHPESIEHRETKLLLSVELPRIYGKYTTAKPEIEVPVPEIKRVIDVLFVFPNGWRVAHEVQLASITTEKLEERTNDYARAGIDVNWWLGKSADTPANREWCSRTFGHVLRLEYNYNEEPNYLFKDRVIHDFS